MKTSDQPELHLKTSDQPELQEFHIQGVRNISPGDAYEMIREHQAVLIDVREENEVKFEQIPLEHVLYHPMSVIIDRLAYISADQNIIVGCPQGIRSTKVVNLLNRQGYPNVANLDGGFAMWKENGLPWQRNLSSVRGCGGGCGCGSTGSGTDASCC
jgi:rhodanese-related sulfurtransferase